MATGNDQNMHVSADPTHYDGAAQTYDALNEQRSLTINTTIAHMLHQHKARSVLDLACGTGSQILHLAKEGFACQGVDINREMLDVARNKINARGAEIPIAQGDMRNARMGKFDAVLIIFNAIGHLTQSDFQTTIKNVAANLRSGGLFLFDICNLDFLLTGNNITKLTVDWLEDSRGTPVRKTQFSTISATGILTSYDIVYPEPDGAPQHPTMTKQTLQVYRAPQLETLLKQGGFNIISHTGIDGTTFLPTATDRMLTLAQKI